MLNKTRNFIQFLDEENLNIFDVHSETEADILYHSESINGILIKSLIIFTDENRVSVIYNFAECTNVMKREQLQDVLNKLNEERTLKYYMLDDGGMRASFDYWSNDENFDCRMLISLYIAFLKSFGENNDMNKIMRIIWG